MINKKNMDFHLSKCNVAFSKDSGMLLKCFKQIKVQGYINSLSLSSF